MELLLIGLGIVVMVGALFLIPLGLPGTWIMVGVLAIAAYFGEVGWPVLLALVALAALAEAAEFFVVERYSKRYGGSRLAFWGALVGGIAGALIGLPVPIVGSMIAGVAGSFAGAAVASLYETRHLPSAARVGWGVLLGRIFATALKTAAGVVMVAVGAGALLLR